MPEAPVDKKDGPMFGQHDVGSAGQFRGVQPESETASVEGLSNHELGSCVLSPNPRHDSTASFPIDGVQRSS